MLSGYCYQVSNQKLIEEWPAVLAFSDMVGYSITWVVANIRQIDII